MIKTSYNNISKIEIMKNIIESKMLYNIKGIVIGHNQILDYKNHQFGELYNIDIIISKKFGSDIKK